jgi:hypothetical protein
MADTDSSYVSVQSVSRTFSGILQDGIPSVASISIIATISRRLTADNRAQTATTRAKSL